MNATLTSGDYFAEVNPGDPLYRDRQRRGYNRRLLALRTSAFVVNDTDQVVNKEKASPGGRVQHGATVLRPSPEAWQSITV
jgi:hypothetical protein